MTDTTKLRESIATLQAEAGIDAWYDMGDDIYENSVDGVSQIPETDQRYIVEASPAVVSALLDEIDQLKATDERRSSLIQRQGAEITRMMDEIDRLRDVLSGTASMLQSACLVMSDPEARKMALDQVKAARAALQGDGHE